MPPHPRTAWTLGHEKSPRHARTVWVICGRSGVGLRCHRRAETVRQLPQWEQDQFVHWYDSVHGRAGVTCEQCHGGNPKATRKWRAHWGVGTARQRRSPVYYKNVPQTCGKCHQEVYESFAESRHFQELISDRLAPSCNTCHGFEMDVGAATPSQLLSRCALCHSPEGGANPEQAALARTALEESRDVRRTIQEGRVAITLARKQGADTTEAEALLQSAEDELGEMGVHWHTFQLHKFKGELAEIQRRVEKARMMAMDAILAD